MNDTENLPQELYNNAWNEMTDFLDDLRNKSPQEIIDSAYKITIHQDLLALLELEKFTPYEIEVFTELDHPLQQEQDTGTNADNRKIAEPPCLHSGSA